MYSKRAFHFVIVLLIAVGIGLSPPTLLPDTALAAAQYTIVDDATGGDCNLIGNWDAATKTCTLTADLNIPPALDGIEVSPIHDRIIIDGA
jgi:hypothetical protein